MTYRTSARESKMPWIYLSTRTYVYYILAKFGSQGTKIHRLSVPDFAERS